MFLRTLYCMIGMLTILTCCAQENISSQEEASVTQLIIENATSCVRDYEENKIYLKEERIHPTSEGVFILLNENGDYARIPLLRSDKSGCFLEYVHEKSMGYSVKVTSPCPFCGWERLSGAFKCKNPDCSSNKKPK